MEGCLLVTPEEKEIDTKKRIEKANAYRDMTMMWAFKDLWSEVLKEKEDRLSQLMSKKGSDDLDITKGFVQATNFINDHIGYVLSGAK